MRDQFLGAYLKAIHQELDKLKNDLLTANLDQGMYAVGKLQGKAVGLRTALEILEQLEEDRDR